MMKTLLIVLAVAAVIYDAQVHKSVQKYCSLKGDAYQICMAHFDDSVLPWGQ